MGKPMSGLKVLVAGVLALLAVAAQAANVAVMVFPAGKGLSPYARAAQTRLEQVLGDNGVTVLDPDKAKELQSSWQQLSDPTFLVTAEDMVARSAKYKIDGIYRVYLNGAVSPAPGGYFSATAHADVRYVDANAQVQAVQSPPMGVRGSPPSDGLTDSAALVNAVQRAIDHAAEKVGLKVFDFTSPRAMSLRLVEQAGLVTGEEMGSSARQAMDGSADKLAPLISESWTFEEPTCRVKSPDGKMVALGTYITQTSRRSMSRSYGARLHLVDLEHQKAVLEFPIHEIGKRGAGENGPSKVLDCVFVGSWRYVAAATGNKLVFYDTERGLLLSEVALGEGPETLRLVHVRRGSEDFLVLSSDAFTKTYALTLAR